MRFNQILNNELFDNKKNIKTFGIHYFFLNEFTLCNFYCYVVPQIIISDSLYNRKIIQT